MASSSVSNGYAATAHQLQRLRSLTPAERIYQEAVKAVQARPEHKGLAPDVVAKITSHQNVMDLTISLAEQRERHPFWRSGDSSSIFDRTKSSVQTLLRFKDAISVLVQTNTMIATPIWGTICFLITMAKEFFDLMQRFDILKDRIADCLREFHAYTNQGDLRNPLHESLIRFYGDIIQFSFTCFSIFKKGKARSVGQIIYQSIDGPFQELEMGLVYSAQMVRNSAQVDIWVEVHAQKQERLRPNSSVSSAAALPAIVPGRAPPAPDLLSGHFTGRDMVLDAIQRSLQDGEADVPNRAAIWGLPGVGKTQIALRFAELHRQTYKHILYVRASSAESLATDYQIIAHTLRLHHDAFTAGHAQVSQEKVRIWLQSNTGWLLIFDDARVLGQVAPFTPLSGSGHILYATRSQDIAKLLAKKQEVHEVQPLSVRAATALALDLQSIRDPQPLHRQAAEELARLVGGLPIAIEQTVQLAMRRGQSLAKLISQFKKRKLLKASHPGSRHDRSLSTGTILTETLRDVAGSSAEAVELFRLLVYLDTSSIPIDMLAAGATQLGDYFDRQQTYDRGMIHTAAQIRARQDSSNKVTRPRLSDQDLLKLDTWLVLTHLRKPVNNTANLVPNLPRIDSQSDAMLAEYCKSQGALRNVLASEQRINNAIICLLDSGLVRRPDGNLQSLWIHDLFAELTIANLEDPEGEPNKTVANVHKIRAHLALTTVFLAFPALGRSSRLEVMDRCSLYLLSAISALRHCTDIVVREGTPQLTLCDDATVGPELAHMVASTLQRRRGPSWNISKQTDDAVHYYYPLAIRGYLRAAERLSRHKGVTPRQLSLVATAEWTCQEYHGPTFARRLIGSERLGSIAHMRLFDTCLKMGLDLRMKELATESHLEEAEKVVKLAVTGVRLLYGEEHEETYQALEHLSAVYECRRKWEDGRLTAERVIWSFLKRTGGGLVDSGEGSYLALRMGFFCARLERWEDAFWWYEVSVRGVESAFGADDRRCINSMLGMAEVCLNMGDYESARGWVAGVVAIRQRDAEDGDSGDLMSLEDALREERILLTETEGLEDLRRALFGRSTGSIRGQTRREQVPVLAEEQKELRSRCLVKDAAAARLLTWKALWRSQLEMSVHTEKMDDTAGMMQELDDD